MTARTLDELPPRATGKNGYVYLVSYSTGTVKVGYTQWPIKRLTALRRDADAFAITITEWWISEERADYIDLERRLLDVAEDLAASSKKREYFEGVDFGELKIRAIQTLANPAVAPSDGVPFSHLVEMAAATCDWNDRAHSLETVSRWLQLHLLSLKYNCLANVLSHVRYGDSRVMTIEQVVELCERLSPGGDLEGERFREPLRAYRRSSKAASLRRDDDRRRAAA